MVNELTNLLSGFSKTRPKHSYVPEDFPRTPRCHWKHWFPQKFETHSFNLHQHKPASIMLLIKRKSLDHITQSKAMSPTISPSNKENSSKRHRFLSIPVIKKPRQQTKTTEQLMEGIATGTMNLSPCRAPSKSHISKLHLDDGSLLEMVKTPSLHDSVSSVSTVSTTGSGSPYRASPRKSSSALSLRSSLMQSMNDTDLQSLKLSVSGLSLIHGSNDTSGNSHQALRRNSVEVSKCVGSSPVSSNRRRHSIQSTSRGANLECDRPNDRSTRSRTTRRRCSIAQSRWKARNSVPEDLSLVSPKAGIRKKRLDETPRHPRRRLSIQSVGCGGDTASSNSSSQSPPLVPRRRSSIMAPSTSKRNTTQCLTLSSVVQENDVQVCSPETASLRSNTSRNSNDASTSTASKMTNERTAQRKPGILVSSHKDTQRHDKKKDKRRHSVTFASDYPLSPERRRHTMPSNMEIMSPFRSEKQKGYITSFLGPGAGVSSFNDDANAEDADLCSETKSTQSREERNHAAHTRSSLVVIHSESQPHLNMQDLESQGLFVW